MNFLFVLKNICLITLANGITNSSKVLKEKKKKAACCWLEQETGNDSRSIWMIVCSLISRIWRLFLITAHHNFLFCLVFFFFLSKDCDDSVTVFTAEKRKDFLLSLMMIFFSLPIFYFRLPKGAIKSLFIFRILRTNWSAGVPAARFPHRTKIKGGTQKSIWKYLNTYFSLRDLSLLFSFDLLLQIRLEPS